MTNTNVCVTGGSGFLGLHVVEGLLSKGYKVNTTTQALTKNNPLNALKERHPDQLTIFEADLLVSGAYDRALVASTAVIHVATPVLLNEKDGDEATLIKPAVDGTKNILDSCLKASSVQTIIITSSFVTVRSVEKPADHVFTESDFNPITYPGNSVYFKSKILAEDVVWEFNEKHKDRFRIATMHPSLIFGPELFPEFNRTNVVKHILSGYLAGGVTSIPNMEFALVDVRDVALAHVRALENEQARGRYLLLAENVNWKGVVDLMRENYPALADKLPKEVSSEKTGWSKTLFDNSKSRNDLQLQYRPWGDSVKDTLNQLL